MFGYVFSDLRCKWPLIPTDVILIEATKHIQHEI